CARAAADLERLPLASAHQYPPAGAGTRIRPRTHGNRALHSFRGRLARCVPRFAAEQPHGPQLLRAPRLRLAASHTRRKPAYGAEAAIPAAAKMNSARPILSLFRES